MTVVSHRGTLPGRTPTVVGGRRNWDGAPQGMGPDSRPGGIVFGIRIALGRLVLGLLHRVISQQEVLDGRGSLAGPEECLPSSFSRVFDILNLEVGQQQPPSGGTPASLLRMFKMHILPALLFLGRWASLEEGPVLGGEDKQNLGPYTAAYGVHQR